MDEQKGVCEVCSEAAVLRADDYAEECHRLTAELTSAKEEIAKVWKLWEVNLDQMGKIGNEQVQGCRELTTLLIEQYDAMKTALASERKETERLREALVTVGELVREATNHSSCDDCTVERKMESVHEYIAAALQSRQGEE